MKKSQLLSVVVGVALIAGCSSSSDSGSGDTGATYATYGSTMAAVVPAGLKSGGANASIAASVTKTLEAPCLDDYIECPYLTALNGGDSDAGEILMRLWALDYEPAECTEALIADGTCFNCVDCGDTADGNFIEPTMLAAPDTCATISTSGGKYVNLGVDPCFFDSIIATIDNIADCETTEGGAVDISTAIPWYASWGIPQEINFSSYFDRGGDGNVWWTINNGTSGADQYFFSLDADWLYAGVKNSENNEFLFLGTGSPAYYEGLGEDSGINISAYAGPLDAITSTFEVIQFRDQGDNQYVERLRSNGTYLWYQKYSGDKWPSTADVLATVKDTPGSNRCVLIGTTKVVESKYVPWQDCVDSFYGDTVHTFTDLNLDSNYTLKLIDAETANEISFTTSLTPTIDASACLPAAE